MGTHVLSLRIDGQLLDRLRGHAAKRGMSVQDYVIGTLVRDDFDERFHSSVEETERFYADAAPVPSRTPAATAPSGASTPPVPPRGTPAPPAPAAPAPPGVPAATAPAPPPASAPAPPRPPAPQPPPVPVREVPAQPTDSPAPPGTARPPGAAPRTGTSAGPRPPGPPGAPGSAPVPAAPRQRVDGGTVIGTGTGALTSVTAPETPGAGGVTRTATGPYRPTAPARRW